MDLDLLLADLRSPSGEGLRLKPYRDSVGKMTIGIGRNLTDDGISEEEAEALCRRDIADAAADLDRQVPWWSSLSDARQRALCELCFNMGWTKFSAFTTFLKLLEEGDFVAAAEDLRTKTLWAKEVQPSRVERICRQISDG